MRIIPVVVAVLLSLDVAAQELRVPLKNWPVRFEQAPVAETRLRVETNAVPSAASHFVSVVPCRVLDTRNSGSPIPTNTTRTVDVPGSGCGIPAGAAAYSMSFTAMNPVDNGYLTAYPTGSTRPTTATMSYLNGGPAFDNAAIVPAGSLGAIDVYVAAQLHLIIDINGYFVEGVVTSLSPGTGVSGGGTGNVTVAIADLGVDTAQLANNAVIDTKLATITAAGKVANSATTATSANTPDTIVARDSAGGFEAGALTLSGKVVQNSVDGLVATGTLSSGSIPATGAGSRLMWYPGKAAFRAGYAPGTEWDDPAIGLHSTAMGYSTTASGLGSSSIGYETTASGNYSTAWGIRTTASGNFSTAFGSNTLASGAASIALGTGTSASGNYSTALGINNTASGAGSTAMGHETTASGTASTAMGSSASTTDAGGTAQPGTFVWGDYSTSNLVRPTAAHQFVARASGGVTFFSNAAMTTGVTLAAGAGSWASVSDRARKHDFDAVDGEDILGRLAALPVTSWRYRDDESGRRYIGPVAQDFHALFGLGTDTTIATLDTDGVTLSAVQALEQRTRMLAAEDGELRADVDAKLRRLAGENALLREQLQQLMTAVARLGESAAKRCDHAAGGEGR